MSSTKHFGRKVRESRENKGLSIRRVAILCDICDETLQDFELGKSDPKLSTVLKIASVLELDLGELNASIPVLK